MNCSAPQVSLLPLLNDSGFSSLCQLLELYRELRVCVDEDLVTRLHSIIACIILDAPGMPEHMGIPMARAMLDSGLEICSDQLDGVDVQNDTEYGKFRTQWEQYLRDFGYHEGCVGHSIWHL